MISIRSTPKKFAATRFDKKAYVDVNLQLQSRTLGKTKLDWSEVPKFSLWVLSAPLSSCGVIAELLQGFGLSGSWLAQPAQPFHYQLQSTGRLSKNHIADLVSGLSRCGAPFEVETAEQMPERYLFHPGLGILRQQLNEAGEVLLRESAILDAVSLSRGSATDLDRRLRLLAGTAWLDLLEVYRHSESVRLLPKAV